MPRIAQESSKYLFHCGPYYGSQGEQDGGYSLSVYRIPHIILLLYNIIIYYLYYYNLRVTT